MTSLYVAWHTKEPPPVWGPVGRLDFEAGMYRFQYTHGATTLDGFEPFDGMPELTRVYKSGDLFPLFKNRLLPRSRPEYRDYLTWSGIDIDDPLEPLLILARTEGIKHTDAVEVFPCPVPNSLGRYTNSFFAHGVRYHLPNAGPELNGLRPGDRLELRPQPQNPRDPNAVAIFSGGTPLGYIPRYLATDVAWLIRKCPPHDARLFVRQLNPDAPLQQRLLCRLDACWPENFQPCRGPEFDPIGSSVSLR